MGVIIGETTVIDVPIALQHLHRFIDDVLCVFSGFPKLLPETGLALLCVLDEIEAALLAAIHELLPLTQLIRIQHISLTATMLSLKIFQTFQFIFLSHTADRRHENVPWSDHA